MSKGSGANDGSDPIKEAEANQFAMELLIPGKLLLEDAKGMDFLNDKGRITELAKKYQVPRNIMTARLYDVYANRGDYV